VCTLLEYEADVNAKDNVRNQIIMMIMIMMMIMITVLAIMISWRRIEDRRLISYDCSDDDGVKMMMRVLLLMAVMAITILMVMV